MSYNLKEKKRIFKTSSIKKGVKENNFKNRYLVGLFIGILACDKHLDH